MMVWARRLTGLVALAAYLGMVAQYYTSVLPGADGLPPDFRLLGYTTETFAAFMDSLSIPAKDTYWGLLRRWDTVFVVSTTAWLCLLGWRGNWVRYVVVGLAMVFAVADLAENRAISRLMFEEVMYPGHAEVASLFTMVKFASLILTVLVLVWHIRRERT